MSSNIIFGFMDKNKNEFKKILFSANFIVFAQLSDSIFTALWKVIVTYLKYQLDKIVDTYIQMLNVIFEPLLQPKNEIIYVKKKEKKIHNLTKAFFVSLKL